MTITVCTAFLNQLPDALGIVNLLKTNMSETSELMVIDNGSTDPVEKSLRSFVKPKKLNYIRNDENVGVIKTMQQAYENCTTDLLIFVHNDVFIYEKEFDLHVAQLFEQIDKLGIVGLFGSQGCGAFGERLQDIPITDLTAGAGKSNMINAESHGLRLTKEYWPVAIIDGFFMGFSMKLLNETKGFDQSFKFHHYYDRDICLESLKHGYKNIVADIPSYHLSGLTANRGDYQNQANDWVADKKGDLSGDKYIHDANAKTFNNKWAKYLPLYVNDDFTFREGTDVGFTKTICE